MQTFLPYESFIRSARVLDDKRLGKQRVEVLQMLKALNRETEAWSHHPCTKMWRGHEQFLIYYGLIICEEWKRRGFRDTCYHKIESYISKFPLDCARPKWLGSEEFHLSHQSKLVSKRPAFYGKEFGWDIPDNLPYIWPV